MPRHVQDIGATAPRPASTISREEFEIGRL